MSDDLVAEKVEIDPVLGAASLRAAEATRLRAALSDLRIGIVHGQQPAEERDATMAVVGERNGGEKAVAERGRAVDAAILAIEKQFGTGSIMKLGASGGEKDRGLDPRCQFRR